jgi:hypothetical protein
MRAWIGEHPQFNGREAGRCETFLRTVLSEVKHR